MPETTDGPHGTEFDGADLTGARFRKTQLNEAQFRMCDLSGALMRDISLSSATVDGEIGGLIINGVEVAPLIEAELTRREPARALRRAPDAAGLQAAWAALEKTWAATYDRVATMPAETVDLPVAEEWSFTETLRHLVFVTDAWLGAIKGAEKPFHPWGLPFTDLPEFMDQPLADLGLDADAVPSYFDVLDLRADRVAKVREFLSEVTPEGLAAEVDGPIWDREEVSTIRCLWVILNEECEHLRFAQRDLDLIEAKSPLVGD